MRYVEGRDLKERFRRGPLSARQAIDLLAQVASALDVAHARGLVHRDVKPSNVLIAAGGRARGDGSRVPGRLRLDEAHSRREGGSRRTGQLIGTGRLHCPGANDEGGDRWAGGCVLTRLSAVRMSERRSVRSGASLDIAVLFAHVEEAPPLLTERRPELPEAIDRGGREGAREGPGRPLADVSRARREARGKRSGLPSRPENAAASSGRRHRRRSAGAHAAGLLIHDRRRG